MISWIIIGRNWNDCLYGIKKSILSQTANKSLYEIILIDDCSRDGSLVDLVKFSKKNKISLIKNLSVLGRSASRNLGIENSNNLWCVFSNSTSLPKNDFIELYLKDINNNNVDIIAGPYHYFCNNDKKFETYLNSSNRGLNKYNNYDNAPFKYVLFGNCAVKKNLLAWVGGFNEKIINYGGEELELLFRINNKVKHLHIIKTNNCVFHHNYPSLLEHCKRLEAFGKNIYLYLPKKLYSTILPKLFFSLNFLIPTRFIFVILIFLYKNFPLFSNIIIKCAFGIAILKGIKNN